MDFAKLMSAQIAKPASTPAKSTKPVHAGPASATFQKRGEVEAAREAAYRAEQAALETERIVKAEKKRQREEEEAAHEREREAKKRRLAEESKKRQVEEDAAAEKKKRKRLGLPELPVSQNEQREGSDNTSQQNGREGSGTPLVDQEVEAEEELTETELCSRLRELKEPTILFGEDHTQRQKRFWRIKRQQEQRDRSSSLLVQSGVDKRQPIPTTLEPILATDSMRVSSAIPHPTDTAGRLHLARQLSTWFNLVLSEWSIALAGRDEAAASTFAGRAALNSYTQAIAHLSPLFRKLEKLHADPTLLPSDLLTPTCSIVRLAQERRYVDANDGYLQLSIGKAAWPIGVTMVGIHERSAREKIGETGGAHILSDEMTRKWLQSVKRCLSFAQTRWPPEDAGQLMG